MKAAIYARYSSDNQKETSIEDQIRICQEKVEKEGWTLVQTYTDYALSAASLMRPGIQCLMDDALAGKFDVVITEDLDRVSRDQEDTAAFYKRMEFSQIDILTLYDGIISDLHIGLKGTISARYLKDLGNKTRRGLRGRVEKGKSGGGISYGYKIVHDILPSGEVDVGGRAIDEVQASIVRRIFNEYLLGRSPKKIAHTLNSESIAGPSGKAWGPSTINGNRQRGTGILNNELYIGRHIWNKLRYVLDPVTRKRVSRLNPEEEWVIKELPELRIIDQDVWDRVKAVQGTLNKKETPLWSKNRPRYLFSGLIKCGVCGGGCSKISQKHIGCSTARNKGTCENRKSIKREDLETAVINALQTHLMDNDLCATFCREYTQHMNEVHRRHNKAIHTYQRELQKLEKENEKMVSAIVSGVDPKTFVARSHEITRRKEELTSLLDSVEESPLVFHPNMAERYHQEVRELIAALNNEEHREEAIGLIRSLVDKIVLTPTGDGKGLSVDLIGDLAGILSIATKGDKPLVESGVSWINQSQQEALVAGAGFEPATFRL